MDDIKSLREEFEALRKQNLECEDNSCQTDLEEEFPDYMVEITTKMLSPARCGVYFSKKDIAAIAMECKEIITLKQRQMMITHLLKSIFESEQMEHLFNVIKNYVDIKVSYYDELADTFPSSKSIFSSRKQQAQKFKASLDRILADNKDSL
jgi:hypothetical protein